MAPVLRLMVRNLGPRLKRTREFSTASPLQCSCQDDRAAKKTNMRGIGGLACLEVRPEDGTSKADVVTTCNYSAGRLLSHALLLQNLLALLGDDNRFLK